MITHGIKHKGNNMVRTKIRDLEKSFKRAVDWRANTGPGILDSSTKTEAEKEAEIKLYLKKPCPFYEELEPVMGERASSRPFATNEDSNEPDEEIGEEERSDANGWVVSLESTSSKASGKKSSRRQLSGVEAWEIMEDRNHELEQRRLQLEENRFKAEQEERGTLKRKVEAEAEEARSNARRAKLLALREEIELRKELQKQGLSDTEIDEFLK
ncbi:hypothetical protein BDR26DRAFT_1013302 [Obelidium mucronatum]|nr:hypothetical protein BDR26DRAFT_1013302 [Obelidium mucronatum]